MDPLTIGMMLMPLIQGAGGAMAGRGKSKHRREILRLSDPQTMLALQRQLYNQFLQSPAYTQGQRSAFTQGNTLQNQLRSSLAARGLGTSGIGSVAPALAGSAASGMLGNLRTGAYNAAGQQANTLLQRQLEALLGAGEEESGFGKGFGSGLGLLGQFVMDKYGQPKSAGG